MLFVGKGKLMGWRRLGIDGSGPMLNNPNPKMTLRFMSGVDRAKK